ncbi:MAG TPA: VTT domain-containing protein [Candidatus Goldiibacteriota bacterium]|nr:VTT domain-containing protein [Candidatus Goldiibacteriota bacterium]
MELIMFLFDFIMHIDEHLVEIVNNYGMWTYLILFLIVFCETGLVITPILPGDSMLFAAGALAAIAAAPVASAVSAAGGAEGVTSTANVIASASGTGLNVWILVLVLFSAAVLGDTANCHIGKFIGEPIYRADKLFLIKKEHLLKTHAFYEKHGGKTIIFARFIPIIRTFAPFVAGIGEMNYLRFLSFNVIGAAAWVMLCVFAGFFFGNIPVVRENFTLVIMGIIFVSILPPFIIYLKGKLEAKSAPKQETKPAAKKPVKKKK